MSTLSTCHKVLTNGVGKCSVPMWMGGFPACFCDEPAYGEFRTDGYYYTDPNTGARKYTDGRYGGYVPALACPIHGGPEKIKVLNLCDHCSQSIPECDGKPEFGTGKGNDNVYQCGQFKPKP